ncbi:unnamed protein product [Calicophoron daubneyi]|uniref:Uncharacterized protein n=1 Tax=Calicophoron daubneyi TaxID=300641 RepID=A0AAV2TAL9_CALDB
MAKFRKLITQQGTQKPSEHDRVTVILSLYVGDALKISAQTLTFDLGHAEDFGVIKLVDEVVETMGFDEQCTALSSCKDGLTGTERKLMGLDSLSEEELRLQLHLTDIQKLNKFWQMSETEKILVAQVMKRRGNKLVQAKKFLRAFRTYKLGIDLLQGSVSVLEPIPCGDNSDPSKSSRDPHACELLNLCLSNAGLCLLHLGAASGQNRGCTEEGEAVTRRLLLLCIKYCRRAIDLDQTYPKSWFRLAKAYAGLREFAEAIEAGQKSLELIKNSSLASQNPQLVEEVKSRLTSWRSSYVQDREAERAAVRNTVIGRYKFSDAWATVT